MRKITKVIVHFHGMDGPAEHPGLPRKPRELHIYKVLGKSPAGAAFLCTQGTQDGSSTPIVAITIEGLKSVNAGHIAVCREVWQTCRANNNAFHLCGVTPDNRAALSATGLLDGLPSQNIHRSVATLMQSLCNTSADKQFKRSPPAFPNLTTPFACLLAN
jgi:hypothetical protein